MEQYAGVLAVVDTSSSMTKKTPDGETRLEVAKRSVNKLAETLLGQNTSDNPDAANMALLAFNKTTYYHSLGWTNDLSTYKRAVKKLKHHVGINWEMALRDALEIANERSAQTGRPVYVIFATDGNPTQTIAGGPDGWPGEAESYAAACPWAKDIVDAGYKLYTVEIYGTVSNLQDLNNYAYTGDDGMTTPGFLQSRFSWAPSWF